MTGLAIDLCVDWVRIAECTAATFSGVVRHLAAGEWSLTGSVDDVSIQDGYTLADVDTIRVSRDAIIVFAGYVKPASSGVGGLDIVASADGETFTLRGTDLWGILSARLAYPTPSTDPPWPDSHDVRVGVASTIAAGFIRDNIGSGALAARQVSGLGIVDGVTGLAGTWSARLQPLDELVIRVCRDGMITCRPSVAFDGTVTFTLGPTRDRTATLVLSDQGDLTMIHSVQVAPTATFVIAGGQGELTSRTFRTAGTASGAARREVFSDQSSLSSATEVQQAATTTLAVEAGGLTVSTQVADIAAERVAYLDDYDLGDVVSVEIGSVRYPVVVESVTIQSNVERSVIRPLLGDAALNPVLGLLRDVANLQSRFRNQIA